MGAANRDPETMWAEESLRQKEAELREAQRIARIGSWHWDAATDVTTGSDELLRIYGLDPATQLMPDFREQRGRLYPVESWERINAAVQRTMQTGAGYELDVEALRADGSIAWVTSRGEAVRDVAGRIIGLRGTVQDISERKRAEAALRESEEHHRLLVETMLQGVVHQDADGRILAMNPAAERILGQTREEFLGSSSVREERHTIREDGSPFPGVEHPAMVALRTGKPLRGVVMGIYNPRAAAYRWISVDAVPLYGAGTSLPFQVYTVFEDITERKQAEEALRNSERLYRAIGESIDYGVWICAPDGRNTYASESFLRLVGLTQQQCSDFGWGEVLHPDDAERTIAAWKECVRSGGNWDIEHRFRGVDGQWHTVLARGVPVRDDRGQITCWAGINLDISRLKQAEQALIRSEKLASVGRVAASIAHEINNPLASVTNLLFLAKGTPGLPESARKYLEIADAELKRVAHITRQSLGFYRETNAPTLSSVNAILDSAVDLLKSRIDAKRARIEKQWAKDVEVAAVAGELRQVFSNLLANALDAIDENGIVKLRVSAGHSFRQGGRCVRVTIADNGAGISKSSRSNIFEPFFTTKGTVGTGLGLWVSKQIIDKHGGTIRVRSSTQGIRRGTVFLVILPAGPTEADASQAPRDQDRPGRGGLR